MAANETQINADDVTKKTPSENEINEDKTSQVSDSHSNTNSENRDVEESTIPNVTNESSSKQDNMFGNQAVLRSRYRNAREYAQVLQPWLWQYYNYNMMNAFFSTMPLYAMSCNPQMSMPWTQAPGLPPADGRGDSLIRTEGTVQSSDFNARGQTGREYRLPSFWKRVAAELIDFTLLFYVKLIVTIVVMREMGYFNGTQVTELFTDLNEIDYDKAFAISSEVIAMEIVNRLLITIFETLCLRKGIGTVGGATPGKRLLGLKVVSCYEIFEVAGGKVFVVPAQNIGWMNALLRSVIKNFTIAFFFPACLTIFFFKHNQAMYDVLSKTIVVQTLEGEL